MSKRIHDRVMVHRRVEYQHTRGKDDGMLLDLSLQGCRIKGVSPGLCGTPLRHIENDALELDETIIVDGEFFSKGESDATRST